MDWADPRLQRMGFTLTWLAVTLGVIVSLHPEVLTPPEKNYERAVALAENGEPEQALRLVREAAAMAPERTGYLRFMGHLQLKLGRHADARDTFERAVADDPHAPDGVLGLAEVRIAQGEPDAARPLLDGLRDVDLDDDHRLRRAGLYSALGDHEAAAADLAGVVSRRPSDAGLTARTLAEATAAGNFELAASLPLPPVNVVIGGATPAENRALALRALGRAKQALELLTAHPRPQNLALRADLARQTGDHALAADLFGRLATVNPGDPAPRRARAFALLAADRPAAAAEAYQELLEEGQATDQDRMRAAWAFNLLGEHTMAWDALAPLERPPADDAALELMARTAFWAGHMDEAAPLLSELLARQDAP